MFHLQTEVVKDHWNLHNVLINSIYCTACRLCLLSCGLDVDVLISFKVNIKNSLGGEKQYNPAGLVLCKTRLNKLDKLYFVSFQMGGEICALCPFQV